MSDANQMVYRSNDRISRNLMRGILVLLITVLALVAYARVTDRPLAATPPDGPIVAERVLHISGNITGEAQITDVDGVLIAEYARGEAVFITTIERVMRRERERHQVDLAGPYHLRMREGARLSIFDPSTGAETELEAFGVDNIAAFEVLLSI